MSFGDDEMAHSSKKANQNYNTDLFFLLDIFVLNTPFSSPNVGLTTSSAGGKHWAVFFPPSN